MAINIGFDDVLGRKKRARRESEARELFLQLLDRGASQDVAKQMSKQYAESGQVVVPEFETKNLPPTNMFPGGIPIRQPAQIGKRRALYTMDSSTGKLTEQPISPDVSDIDIRTYNSSSDSGDFVVIDPLSGQVVSRVPRQKGDRAITKPKPSTGGKDRPDVALAKKFLADLQKDIDLGMPIDPERMETAKTAAEVVGNVEVSQDPSETVTTEPGRVAKFFGAEPKTTTIPGKTKVKYGENQQEAPPPVDDQEMAKDIARAKKAIQLKLVTREDAIRRLKKQYKDRLPQL